MTQSLTERQERVDSSRPWRRMTQISPYARELGLVLESDEPQWCVLRVPFSTRFAASQSSTAPHGAVVTALLDSCFGLAVLTRVQMLKGIATLDLRIDHLSTPLPDKDLLGGAVCYKITQELAFLRGCAYYEEPGDPIATATATFMFTAAKLEGE